MASILCLDTDPDTVKELKALGHDVEFGDIGFRRGLPTLKAPPHEFDLIICDMKQPACYNALNWGPDGNNNFSCKIVNAVKDEVFIKNGEYRPKFQIIQKRQMPKMVPGTFGSKDVLAAIERAGVPAIIFLNPEWVQHVGYESPDIMGVQFKFKRTKARKITTDNILKTMLPDLDTSYSISLPVQYAISDTTKKMVQSLSTHVFHISLVSNAIEECFGQYIPLGNGSIWALPTFDNNVEVINRLAENINVLQNTQCQLNKSNATQKTLTEFASAMQKISQTMATKPHTQKSPQRETIPMVHQTSGERDVFISHASEDKDAIARPLAEALRKLDVSLWFDEYEFTLGDSFRQKIEEGLSKSRYGIVILSHNFFSKHWPKKELDGLFALETDKKKILPIWHELSAEEVKSYSPILADRYATSSDQGINKIVQEILKVINK